MEMRESHPFSNEDPNDLRISFAHCREREKEVEEEEEEEEEEQGNTKK